MLATPRGHVTVESGSAATYINVKCSSRLSCFIIANDFISCNMYVNVGGNWQFKEYKKWPRDDPFSGRQIRYNKYGAYREINYAGKYREFKIIDSNAAKITRGNLSIVWTRIVSTDKYYGLCRMMATQSGSHVMMCEFNCGIAALWVLYNAENFAAKFNALCSIAQITNLFVYVDGRRENISIAQQDRTYNFIIGNPRCNIATKLFYINDEILVSHNARDGNTYHFSICNRVKVGEVDDSDELYYETPDAIMYGDLIRAKYHRESAVVTVFGCYKLRVRTTFGNYCRGFCIKISTAEIFGFGRKINLERLFETAGVPLDWSVYPNIKKIL